MNGLHWFAIVCTQLALVENGGSTPDPPYLWVPSGFSLKPSVSSRSPTNTLSLYTPLKLRNKCLNMHGDAQKAALLDACSCLHNHYMSADNRSGPECTGMGLELPYLSEELPCSDLLNPDPVFSSGSEGLTFSFFLFRWFSSCGWWFRAPSDPN